MGRGETRALISWGGGYSYIRVLPEEFLLKSIVFKFISKEINALVSPLGMSKKFKTTTLK